MRTKLAFSVAYFRRSVRSVCIVVPRMAPVKKDVNAKAYAHSGLQLNWRSRLLMERSIMCITCAQIGHGFHETRFSRRPTTRFHRSGRLNRSQTSPSSTTVRSKAEGLGTEPAAGQLVLIELLAVFYECGKYRANSAPRKPRQNAQISYENVTQIRHARTQYLPPSRRVICLRGERPLTRTGPTDRCSFGNVPMTL